MYSDHTSYGPYSTDSYARSHCWYDRLDDDPPHDRPDPVADLRRSALPPAEAQGLSSVLALGRAHSTSSLLVWGPALIRSVLCGDDPRHRNRSLEERRAMVSVLRRLVILTHAQLDLDPDWRAETLEAISRCRESFYASARTDAQIRRSRRAEEIGSLAGGRAVEGLDTSALPEESLQLEDVRCDIRDRVQRVGELLDRAMTGVRASDATRSEVLTVARRALAGVAPRCRARSPRQSRDENIASALVMAAAEYNGIDGCREAVAAASNVPVGSMTSRRTTLLELANARPRIRPSAIPSGLECAWLSYRNVFTDPTLQTADTRRLIVETYRLVSRGDPDDEARDQWANDKGDAELDDTPYEHMEHGEMAAAATRSRLRLIGDDG